MLEALKPPRIQISIDRVLIGAVIVLLIAATVGPVALVAMGRLGFIDAIFYLALPWVLLAAVFRPDWLILIFVAAPAMVIAEIPIKRLLVLIAVAVVMQLLTRQKFSLGLGTGLAALLAINVAGQLFEAEVSPDALSVNEGTMLALTYYILLALLAFNLALDEELNGERLATALVIGVAATLAFGLAGYRSSWFPSGIGILSHTYLGPLASGAFGVGLARILMVDDTRRKRFRDFLITGGLLYVAIVSFQRASWITVAITAILVAFRLHRRGYVLFLMMAIMLTLFTPTTRENIARSETGDILAEIRSGEITTGRWELWSELWERGWPALPFGTGFGYMWSLTSEDLLGEPGEFQSEETGAVPPHNDFLYMFVEFGMPGVILLLLFWIGLFRSRSLVSTSADPEIRRSGWLFLGVIVAALIVALIDDIFLVRPVAEKFFPVAGFIFGLGHLERARRERTRNGYATPEALPT